MRSVLRSLVLGWALLAAVTGAWAHDPFEITAAGRLREGELELRLTMAKSAATIAGVEGATAAKTFADDVFDEMQRRLMARASRLVVVRVTGLELPLTKADVVLTAESDVEFILRYPRPPGGALTLDAVFLPLLPDSAFGATLTVHADDGALLGQKFLNAEDHALTVRVPDLPAVNAPKAAAAGAIGSARTETARAAKAEELRRNSQRLLVVCGALVLVFVAAWWAVRRRLLRG